MSASIVWAVLILIIIFMFKPQLTEILYSFNKRGKITYKGLGVNLELGGTNHNQGNSSTLNKYDKSFQSLIITEEEDIIRNQVEDLQCDDEKKIEILIYQVANKNILLRMYNIDKMINYEHVRLLHIINNTSGEILNSDLQKYYDNLDFTKEPYFDLCLDNFLKFLYDYTLLKKDNDKHVITVMGNEYLSHRIKTLQQTI